MDNIKLGEDLAFQILGLPISAWALIVAIFAGIVLPIYRNLRDWRKQWKAEHPIIRLQIYESIKSPPLGVTKYSILAEYHRGKVPVTLLYPMVVFTDDGKRKNISPYCEDTTALTPKHPRHEFHIDIGPFPKGEILGVRMSDLVDNFFYSHNFPKEFRITRRHKMKWAIRRWVKFFRKKNT